MENCKKLIIDIEEQIVKLLEFKRKWLSEHGHTDIELHMGTLTGNKPHPLWEFDKLKEIIDLLSKKPKDNIKVITLCGSTKFKRDFRRIEKDLNAQGNLVIPFNFYEHIDDSDPRKEMLEKIHSKRIDLSDAIYVINKDGYIGNSTKQEIEYADKKGKEILYLENL